MTATMDSGSVTNDALGFVPFDCDHHYCDHHYCDHHCCDHDYYTPTWLALQRRRHSDHHDDQRRVLDCTAGMRSSS